jgi:hypothetical protein
MDGSKMTLKVSSTILVTVTESPFLLRNLWAPGGFELLDSLIVAAGSVFTVDSTSAVDYKTSVSY